jgi:hypothetical protein
MVNGGKRLREFELCCILCCCGSRVEAFRESVGKGKERKMSHFGIVFGAAN